MCQKPFDKGIALAALFEQMDSANTRSLIFKVSDFACYLQKLFNVDMTLAQWFQEFLREGPAPSTDSYLDESPAPSSLPPFAFLSFRVAKTIVSSWTLRTVLSKTVALTCGAILSNDSPFPPEFASAQVGLDSEAQYILSQHGDALRMELATNILRSMPYCTDDNTGILGTQKSLFP